MLGTLEFALGLLIAGYAMVDIYASVVVPRRLSSRLHVERGLAAVLFPPWRAVAKSFSNENRRQDLLSLFPPVLLLASFIAWTVLLMLGFGLIAHALQDQFEPETRDLTDAIYQAGLLLTTLGLSGFEAQGAARWMAVTAGFAGFSVITLIITFILSLQSGLQQREVLVLTLGERTGRPPSGLTMLETEAQLGLRTELDSLFMRWEVWAAGVLHSHGAFPILAYFRSADHDNDWLSAFGAVLDAAALVRALVEERPEDAKLRGQAFLLHRAGSRAARDLCALFHLQAPDPIPADLEHLQEAHGRLLAAGYAVRDPAQSVEDFRRLSADYAGHLHALAAYFGVTAPNWLRNPTG